eukprot:gene25174-31603_t
MSVNYTGGGVRFVLSSDTPDFVNTEEDINYEGFHDIAEGETSEHQLTHEISTQPVEPEGIIHLSLGQAAVFTSHMHFEVNPVLSGQMLLLVGQLSIGSTTACDVHNVRNPRDRARLDNQAFNWVVTLVAGVISGALVLLVGMDWLEKRRHAGGSGNTKKKD